MSGFSEASTVQAWLADRLKSGGWDFVEGRKLPRELTQPVVEDWLIEALEILNPALHGAPERVDEVLPLIRSAVLSAGTDGLVAANERLVTLLRGDHTVKYVGTDEYVPSLSVSMG
jgi:type I restriction enzyme, R subunit